MTFDDTKQASKHSTCSFPNRIIPTSKYLQPLQFSPRIPWIHRCRLYRWVSWGSHLDRQLYDGYNMPVVWGNISIYIYIRCLFWWIYEPASTIESVKSFEHCSVELHVKSDGWCIEHKNARDEEFRILYLEICHCDELKSEKNGFDNFVGNMWERIWCLTTFHHMRDQGHPQGLLPSWSMSRIATVTDELRFVKWPSFPPLVLEKADRAEFNRFSKISNCKVTMLQPAC